MRSLITVLLVLSLGAPAWAAQLQMARVQPRVDLSRHEPRMDSLSPSLRDWVTRQARATLDSGADPDPEIIAGAARARLDGQDFSNADIESLVQLVLMESVRQADADLRDTMAQMRAANQGKARIRETATAQKEASKGLSEAARAEYSRPESKAVCVDPPCQFEAKTNPDSMSETNQMGQMRMQTAMDRRAKFMEALSNLMKKSSDTASTITSNLK